MTIKKKIIRACRISRLFKKMASAMVNADFFLQGKNLLGMEERYPGYVEGLIEANEFLQNVKIDRYIGSGAVGDAWLLENGTVLKIFDNNMKNELDKYQNIHDMLFSKEKEERAKASYEVMVYDFGTLDEPIDPELRGLEPHVIGIPRQKRFVRWDMRQGMEPTYWPSYVILEKLETVDDRARKYVDTFETLEGPETSFQLPIWLRESFQKSGKVGEFGFPDWFERYYGSSIRAVVQSGENPVDKLINFYIQTVINLTIRITKDHFDRESRALLLPEDLHEYSQLRGKSAIEEWSNDLHIQIKSGWHSSTIPVGDYKIVKDLLGLRDEWVKDLIYLTMDKLAKGQRDVHMDNLGFRKTENSPFIYFDA
ncbi:MAG: hypothetical protein CBE07_001550 [Pelagibacteraceae bacterium TMED247]|nr:MAG: hypothetical protein CBE07_001550 [Pelagibacteraceae bacterium TMED247]|tara:strand:+ start:1381 stop:2484 length:1104 start_codon:yes stop_codon:yes gene_type:complete